MSMFPSDILRIIFLFSIKHQKRLKPSRSDTPWTLTQVYRKWRLTALETSALWCELYISNSLYRKTNIPIHVYRAWMERSAVPLDIYLNLEFRDFLPDSFNRVDDSSKADGLDNLVHTHVGKMRRLRVELRKVIDPARSLALQNLDYHCHPPLLEGATSLEHLEVVDPDYCLLPVSATNFPKLTSFIFVGDVDRIQPLPWYQLTNLELLGANRYGHRVDFLDILSQSPELHVFKCRLVDSCETEHCGYKGGQITLKHLTKLYLHGTPSGLMPFLDSLRTPSLQNFGIEASLSSDLQYATFKDTLASFMAKEAQKLMHFYLRGDEYSNDQLLALLREVSDTLRRFEVNIEPSFGDEVLSALSVSEDGATLYPHLEFITLSSWTAKTTPGLVASMADSRLRWLYPLRGVYIKLSPAAKEDDYHDDEVGLLRLHEEGRLEMTVGR